MLEVSICAIIGLFLQVGIIFASVY